MKNNYCSEYGAKKEELSLELSDDLKITQYQNGDTIPCATSNDQWIEFGEKKIGAYSITEDGNCLYNWYAVEDDRGLSPKGWRIPTDEEWDKLEEQLKNNPSYAGYRKPINGNYNYVGNLGYFWSSTESSSLSAWFRLLNYKGSDVYRGNDYKQGSFSVRCVKEKE